MAHPVVHFEIGCRVRESTSAFYRSLFDWEIDAAAQIPAFWGGLTGHLTSLGHEPHNYTIFYVQVDDISAAIARAVELGGKHVVGPIPIPTGAFAWIQDPAGNTVGLFKPAAVS
ncbi:MAG: VOC family protein [Acidobacteriota bacterium]